jgi:hypothetical protein
MFKRVVFAFASFALSVPAAAGQPQPIDTPQNHQPDRAQVTLDQARARRFMNDFAHCIASRQPRKAAAVLSFAYGSRGEQEAAYDIGKKEYECLGPFSGNLQMSLDGPSLAAGMAEFFIAHPGKIEDVRRRDPQSFVRPDPLSWADDIGECAVAQNPAAVEALIKSEVASKAEDAAMDALAPQVGACVAEGQKLELDRAGLRQLLAVSLYRHIAMPAPAAAPTAPTPATTQQH